MGRRMNSMAVHVRDNEAETELKRTDPNYIIGSEEMRAGVAEVNTLCEKGSLQ
jgi:hypothetical protein